MEVAQLEGQREEVVEVRLYFHLAKQSLISTVAGRCWEALVAARG